MSFNLQKCPHIESEHCTDVDLRLLKPTSCHACNYTGLNLWICLYRDCGFTGCSEQANDHSTEHFQTHKHGVHMNISSQRVWCYYCERELYLKNSKRTGAQDKLFSCSMNSLSKREDSVSDDATGSGTGLVGLQNIANTCYMNSALQALSNLLPLTHYFINCGELVEHIAEQSAPRCKPAGLAKSYLRLMDDIWQQTDDPKEFIAPRGILYGIRSVHPMFRGYQQHDTQEFLRCFMDQLHDELTEQIHALQQNDEKAESTDDDKDDDATNACTSNTPNNASASDSEYDTCDSSLSDRSTRTNHDSEVFIKSEYYVSPSRSTNSASDMPSVHQSQQQQKQRQKPTSEIKPVDSARSIISDIFDGKLLSSVQCLTCDRISTREETFQDLSLPIPNRDFLNMLHQTHSLSVQSLNAVDMAQARNNEGWLAWMWNMLRSWFYGPSVTLYDCMASFFSADELKGDNMYSCERCNKLRTGIKYSRVLNLPEVLCIHLKRFRHDLSYSSKISSHVYFPLEGFDMRPYLHKDCKSMVATYNLSSVICHHGTVGGGHYTCYARNALNGRWYEFDDQFVTEVSPDIVQNCQAYVLFYQKHNPHMKMLREEAITLCNLNPLHHADIQFYVTREWLSRLATFAEPGPINNREMLCPHGGILHSKTALISQIAVPISQPLWDFLFKKFGGGPAVNMMFECEICRRVAEALSRRQLYELTVFTKYNGLQSELDSSAIYAIAMPWLRMWQQFSRGITHKEPGPIANEGIAAPAETNSLNGSIVSCVRLGSDYAQLNAPLWRFLHSIYGGGPEIMLRSALSDDDVDEIEIIDQDDESISEEEREHNAIPTTRSNQSDTESNLGRSATLLPETQPIDAQVPSNATHFSKASSDSIVASSPNSKRTRSSGQNSRNIKVSALRMNMRKRGRRNRNAFKQHADMFGAKGHYNSSNQQLVYQAESISPSQEDKDTAAFSNEYTIPFQSDNFQVNGDRDATKMREKGKIRNSNKENVTLQKFVTLREPSGANDETDI
ncbi:ubiquitin carboxyl-terminal hydrolase 20 [Scaptodrosophila lebanonensis]|uniref:ubiquitinyl hydrolase 1 n=1 Tax=Drosophila lebanonensis TaxID=7225 RepID=A0A6J2T3E7_DROLE|nr:ubiquitin carboxyl-terminal hydrolase 20 [Scaptodrosophila lebanonensis]